MDMQQNFSFVKIYFALVFGNAVLCHYRGDEWCENEAQDGRRM